MHNDLQAASTAAQQLAAAMATLRASPAAGMPSHTLSVDEVARLQDDTQTRLDRAYKTAAVALQVQATVSPAHPPSASNVPPETSADDPPAPQQATSGAQGGAGEHAAAEPTRSYMRQRFLLQCVPAGLFPQLQSQWGSGIGLSLPGDAERGAVLAGGWKARLLYSNQLHVWASSHGPGSGSEQVLVIQRRPTAGLFKWRTSVLSLGGVEDAAAAVAIDVIAWCVVLLPSSLRLLLREGWFLKRRTLAGTTTDPHHRLEVMRGRCSMRSRTVFVLACGIGRVPGVRS